jgi:hypothetical protein
VWRGVVVVVAIGRVSSALAASSSSSYRSKCVCGHIFSCKAAITGCSKGLYRVYYARCSIVVHATVHT